MVIDDDSQDQTVKFVENFFKKALGDANTLWGQGVNYQVFLDGNIKNSSINSDPVMQFTQLKQALNNQIQAGILYPSGQNFSNYINQSFMLGIDCNSFDDDGTIFGGSPCTNLNIQMTGPSVPSTNIAIVLVCYDTIVAFTGDGLIEVKR